MRILEPDVVSLSELQELAALARNRICRLYLHWTAGRYGEFYDDYHLNIDADGNVYRTCCALTDYKPHTWQRNTGSIGITLCCAGLMRRPTMVMMSGWVYLHLRRSSLTAWGAL